MSRALWMVLLTALSSASCLSAPPTASAPNTDNPKLDWLYAKSIPTEARQKLLPLYQRQADLLQELDFVKWQAAQDTLRGLFSVGAGVVRATNSSASATVAEESAARAGQKDARFRGSDAALAAQSGVQSEMFPSVRRGADIVSEVNELDNQIATIQRQFGIQTIGPASFRPRVLTTDAVTKMLAPVAAEAAKPVGPAPWTGDGTMGVGQVANGGTGSGEDFDPAKLTQEGRAGWQRTQTVIRNETLNEAGSQQSAAAGTVKGSRSRH